MWNANSLALQSDTSASNHRPDRCCRVHPAIYLHELPQLLTETPKHTHTQNLFCRLMAEPLSLSRGVCSAWFNLAWCFWLWAATQRPSRCCKLPWKQTLTTFQRCLLQHSCCWHQPSSAPSKAPQVTPTLAHAVSHL